MSSSNWRKFVPQVKQTIFEAFTRADVFTTHIAGVSTSGKARIVGHRQHGLGLAISQDLCQMINSEITLADCKINIIIVFCDRPYVRCPRSKRQAQLFRRKSRRFLRPNTQIISIR